MGNKEYWDNKFEKRGDNPLNPETTLVNNINLLKKGSVLDLACGDGRNTLFLLENNFEVIGVDFSDKALERLDRFAKGFNYSVTTKQLDLSKSNSLKGFGVFDNIVINHYRLNQENLNNIEKHISYNGILFISGFGKEHKVDEKIKGEDLIQAADFQVLNKSFKLIKYIESEDNRGCFVTYIFQKK